MPSLVIGDAVQPHRQYLKSLPLNPADELTHQTSSHGVRLDDYQRRLALRALRVVVIIPDASRVPRHQHVSFCVSAIARLSRAISFILSNTESVTTATTGSIGEPSRMMT